jgi:hypothetical protein
MFVLFWKPMLSKAMNINKLTMTEPEPDPETCTLADIAKWAKTDSWSDYMYEYDRSNECNECNEWKTVQYSNKKRRSKDFLR